MSVVPGQRMMKRMNCLHKRMLRYSTVKVESVKIGMKGDEKTLYTLRCIGADTCCGQAQ